MRMNSGRVIKVTNRLYTLSSWVSLILEAGFQITQIFEPHVDPKAIPADAPNCRKTSGNVLGVHLTKVVTVDDPHSSILCLIVST